VHQKLLCCNHNIKIIPYSAAFVNNLFFYAPTRKRKYARGERGEKKKTKIATANDCGGYFLKVILRNR